ETAVYNNDLIVLGAFTRDFATSTPLNGIGRWDGTAWHGLGSGFPNAPFFTDRGNAAIQYGADLIMAGSFTSRGGTAASNLARWDGSAWSEFGGGVDGEAYALDLFEGDLIVAGEFQHAGGVPVRSVARWNGASWSAMGDNVVEIYALRVVNDRLF